MAAISGGGGWWSIDPGEDRARYEQMVEKAGHQVLKNLPGVIIEMIRARDADSLTSLQVCYGELFRRAAECMASDSDMEIENG